MEHKRGGFGSSFGFIMAAVGSAVGLGNIWGFPFKMGANGGFTFLLVYLALAVFAGFAIMLAELSLGRKTGMGVIGAYGSLSKKYTWIGWLAMIAPFCLMSFYCTLGGYCIQYLFYNLSQLSFGGFSDSGNALFAQMLNNQLGAVVFTTVFLWISFTIVKGGISGGIEKFNKIGMPALFILLIVVIIRSLTLPGAIDGLKFMFVPGWSLANGYLQEAPSFLAVLSTAGSQMFFSLSLAMGAMVTYGSYLKKKENLVKNSFLIIIFDTIVALMAGAAVIPAAIATYGQNAQLDGPNLLFVTLQDVFNSMGVLGPLFGAVFYSLVIVAALSSSISLLEVLAAFLMDRRTAKGLAPKRTRSVLIVVLTLTITTLLVALDGLGTNHLWNPMPALGSWLGTFDFLAEGIAMPLGALFMSILFGWVVKPGILVDEIRSEGYEFKGAKFFVFSLKYLCPIIMALVLFGQLNDFLGLGLA